MITYKYEIRYKYRSCVVLPNNELLQDNLDENAKEGYRLAHVLQTGRKDELGVLCLFWEKEDEEWLAEQQKKSNDEFLKYMTMNSKQL